MKKVILTGGTGMVGRLVLDYCLADDTITEVVSLVRRTAKVTHPKLKEIIVKDFTDYTAHADLFQNITAAYFCIGVYTGQVPDEQFKQITVDYAVAFGQALKANSPNATLCLLSGAGADRTEKSRVSFAKYKGMAENRLSALGLGGFYTLRPGYIYPVTPRQEPNLMYSISRSLYPLIRLFGKNSSIKSTELARGIFNVGLQGAKQEILENRDILLTVGS